ncbi:MAG: 2'-5' RNA ligase family protein [Anaerolineae bacterium]|nr:2'-5' RNA ligase family protein [Anaerolineae bacterium]
MTDEGERALEAAVVILAPPEVAAFVESFRARYLNSENQLIPAHITVLYPFVSPGTVATGPDSDVIVAAGVRLGQACREAAPFTVTLDHYATFPTGGVLFLAPQDPAPIVALQQHLQAAFPEYPPYGGLYADFIPHMTLGFFENRERLEAAPRPTFAPFTFRVETLHFLYGDFTIPQRWTTAAIVPLGGETRDHAG